MIPWFDPTGRLFLASGDPTPANVAARRAQEEQDLKYGVRSINEIRSEQGLSPVPWDELSWLTA